MTIYYVDHSDDNVLKESLGEKCLGFQLIEDDPDEHDCKEGDLVFLHTNEKDSWIKDAKENPEIDFVFISTVGSGGIPNLEEFNGAANIHNCSIPALDLCKNQQFNEFLNNLDSGIKSWQLLQLQSNTFNYLTALIILCQGFLVVNEANKKSSENSTENVLEALELIGWNALKDQKKLEFREQLKSKFNDVSQTSWWLTGLLCEEGSDKEKYQELKNNIIAESKDERLPMTFTLLEKLFDNKVLEEMLIADTYCEIAYFLKGQES